MDLHLGFCAICKDQKQQIVLSLHGDQGGPSVCPVCSGKWHAEHARKRKAGRVVIRAIKAFEEAGGSWKDVDKLKISSMGGTLGGFWLDPLGYMADAINTDGEITDLTLELLNDIIPLVHPDCHPPERKELAKSVTQRLLALRPFCFPAPKPKETVPAPPHNTYSKSEAPTFKEPLHSYPCKECKSTIPCYYCTSCRAEWEKRLDQEREAANKKQREQYARRKARRALLAEPVNCATCGKDHLRFKRKGSKFCSDACRQKAHRRNTSFKVQPGDLKEPLRVSKREHIRPDRPTFAELGISKSKARRMRRLAAMSDAEFEAAIKRTRPFYGVNRARQNRDGARGQD